jgi:hypothetical protein
VKTNAENPFGVKRQEARYTRFPGFSQLRIDGNRPSFRAGLIQWKATGEKKRKIGDFSLDLL